MPDIVVTVPMNFRWEGSPNKGLHAWCDEGDCAGEPWSGQLWVYTTWGVRPCIKPGERVYVVCERRLRGYAPLVELDFINKRGNGQGYVELWRGGDAHAVTIPDEIVGFRGWQYRWWERADEKPFPDWRGADMPLFKIGAYDA